MPATVTGRGGQVLLTGTAQKAARGAAGASLIDNTLTKLTLELAGLISDGNSSDGTSANDGAYDNVVQPFPGDWVTPEQFGAFPATLETVATAGDSTAALQAALDTGRMVYLRGRAYRFTTTLVVPMASEGAPSVGIIGPGVLYAPAASFSNSTQTVNAFYGSTGLYINASGQTASPYTPNYNILLKDFVIQGDPTDGRVNTAILMRNVYNSEVSGVEIRNMPMGYGIAAASCLRCRFDRNYIHDFYTNAVWASIPQSTAILLDDNRINSIASDKVSVSYNHIQRIEMGPVPVATWHYQTDGINIHEKGNRYTCIGNIIELVGEAFDFFADNSTIAGNTIKDAKNFGIKLIYGASDNAITGNTIQDSGVAGIILSGHSNAIIPLPVARNTITGNIINGVNTAEATTPPSGYGIDVDGNGLLYQPTGNLISDNIVNVGTAASYGVRVNLTDGVGTGNIIVRNYVSAGGSGNYGGAPTDGVTVWADALPTQVIAYQAAAQSIATSVSAALVKYDTVVKDLRAEVTGLIEWDASGSIFTARTPGVRRFTAQVRIVVGANTEWTLNAVYTGGVVIACSNAKHVGGSMTLAVSGSINMIRNDTLRFQIQNLGDVGRTVTTGRAFTTVMIES